MAALLPTHQNLELCTHPLSHDGGEGQGSWAHSLSGGPACVWGGVWGRVRTAGDVRDDRLYALSSGLNTRLRLRSASLLDKKPSKPLREAAHVVHVSVPIVWVCRLAARVCRR